MTTFFLVRHATHDRIARVLVGRMTGVHVSHTGCRQARRVADHLARQGVTAVHSSPRERARETAAIIALRAGVPLKIAAALDELDVGEWTGQPFAALADDVRWSMWNSARGFARPPRGESMSELQRRIVGYLDRVRRDVPRGRVVLVSHAEPIRAAILHCLGMPLDRFAEITIDPAAVTTVADRRRRLEVLRLNATVAA